MAILYRKVNKIAQDKVAQIFSQQAEIEILKSLSKVMKSFLHNTHLQDTLSVFK